MLHNIEAFGGGELVRPAAPRTRPTMQAFQVTGERNFPHDVHRNEIPIVVINADTRGFRHARSYFLCSALAISILRACKAAGRSPACCKYCSASWATCFMRLISPEQIASWIVTP